ncbi:SIMPL domain-containing protein [Bacillus sp. B1-b2]|uniref:SIMPL domain-containing protein n=1 Tax=Bacillus sp. B1-b2 TaxID=2653201 RepID=UPI0012625983|nr:SIMPL domain-containing protein [Bacillus sp. B1-b2]KAB7670709.1 DUF541 domain-containing protein [Bacillus sp. B1-b2]
MQMYRANTVVPTPPSKNSITVFGNGSIQVEPELSKVTIGIVTEDDNLTTAQSENAAIQQRVRDSLIRSGIENKDIQTVDYTIYPKYDYIDNKQVFNGYEVTHMLTVQVNNIQQTGSIVDTATQSGANRITSIEFDVINRNVYYQQALQIALQDALQKAITLANTLQINLNQIPTKILEIPPTTNPVPLAKYNVTAVNASSTNIEAGQLIIEAKLEVRFQY